MRAKAPFPRFKNRAATADYAGMNAIANVPTAPAGPELDGRRILAAVIDLALVILGGVVLTTIVSTVAGGDGGFGSMQVRVIMVAWALYYFFALESGDGQTIGKKVMKLRVVTADGSALTMREVAIRTVLRVVDVFAGLVVMIVTKERRQRLGDLAAGTMVADASAPPADQASAATASPEAAEPLTPDNADDTLAEIFAPPQPADTPDVGTPLAGATPTESPAPSGLEDFDPYSLTQEPEPAAAPAEEPAVEEPAPSEPAYPAPVEEPAAEQPAEPSLGEPEPPPGPVEEPAAEQPAPESSPIEPAHLAPVEEEFAPEEPSLSEPAHPAPVEEPAAEESAPEQPSPIELAYPAPVEEPAAEEPAPEEPSLGGSAYPAPAPVEEPAAEEPAPEEPSPIELVPPAPVEESTPEEASPVEDAYPALAPVEELPGDEPVAQGPAFAAPVEEPESSESAAPAPVPSRSRPPRSPIRRSPSGAPTRPRAPAPVEDSAADEPSPEESLARLLGDQAAEDEDEPEDEDDEDVSVRSVETMSAIDMVMGEDEDRGESPEGDDGREHQDQ